MVHTAVIKQAVAPLIDGEPGPEGDTAPQFWLERRPAE